MKAPAILVAAVTLIAVGTASAHDAVLGPVTITHPWSRATVKSQRTGVVYMDLENSGRTDDELIAAASPVAETVQLHTNIVSKDGVVMMRPVTSITVPAQGEASLKPGGFHIMLIGLKAPLKAGLTIPLTLEFAHAGSTQVEVEVEPIGAARSGS